MKTKRLIQKNLLTVFAIAICVSFAVTDAVTVYAADSRRDRVSQGGSMFSPGYINAAKQKTEDVLEQSNQKQSFAQNMVNYIQNKMGYKVADDVADDFKPNLKMKTSEGEAQAVIAVGGMPMELPRFLDPNKARDMMNRAIDKGATMTTLTNGNVVTVWNDETGNYFSVVDSQGRNILESCRIEEIPLADSFYVNGITDMGNGGFLLDVYGGKWESSSTSDSYSYSGYSMQSLRSYDANGEFQSVKDYNSHYSYYYNRRTNVYNYSSESNSVSNITYLGEGNLAMNLNTYSYSYGNGSYSSSDKQYIRVVDTSLGTTLDYQLNRGGYDSSTGFYNHEYVNGIASLGNGQFVVASSQYGYGDEGYRDGTCFTVMDKNLKTYGSEFIENSWSYENGKYESNYQYMTQITSLGEGKFAVAWDYGRDSYDESTGISDYESIIKVDVYGVKATNDDSYFIHKKSSENLGTAYEWYSDGTQSVWSYNYVSELKGLDDGSLVIAINGDKGNYDYSTGEGDWCSTANLKVMDNQGRFEDIKLGSLDKAKSKSISQITTLGDGNFGVVLYEEGYTAEGIYVSGSTAEQFSSKGANLAQKGNDKSNESDTSRDGQRNIQDTNKADYDNSSDVSKGNQDVGDTKLKKLSIDKSDSSLSGMDEPLSIAQSDMDPEDLLGLLSDSLSDKDALAAYSIFGTDGEYMNVMSLLNSIFKNPTEDQKKIIDTLSTLLMDMEQIKKSSLDPSAMGKAVDELVQMVAAVLLAQALPDLITDKDVANIRGIFADLGIVKGRIMSQYQEAITPYYDEVRKMLAQNIDALQQQNILSKSIIKEEIDKLPRNEIDKIIEKLKKAEKKGFEEQYILQQEAKAREKYIDPSKKTMEEGMKFVLNDFTKRLNSTLDSAGSAKKAAIKAAAANLKK
ncbi:MAG: hypothetical protein WC779_03605 [Candidatus Omnitrophota bacterium]